MIDYQASWKGYHYRRLVQHFESFSAFQLKRLAKVYQCPEASAEGLATSWCMQPDRVREHIDHKLRGTPAWDAVEQLVLDHDIPVLLDWLDGHTLRQLIDVGLVRDQIDAISLEDQFFLPGAIAALMAPLMTGVRPSLLVLLGRAPQEVVESLTKRYELPFSPGLTSVLAMSELFMDPSSLDRIVGSLPEPEWLGGALIVLELGGVCYWQEVFGAELDDDDDSSSPSGRSPKGLGSVGPSGGGGKVVPLMTVADRMQERDIANTLIEIGLIHRFDDPVGHYPLVAVPEELWQSLWMMGRMWLLEWAEGTFHAIEDSATRADAPATFVGGLQSCAKWLATEGSLAPLTLDPGEEPCITSLRSKSKVEGEPSTPQLGLMVELGLFELKEHALLLQPEAPNLLNLPRQSFAREVLARWAGCHLGRHVDARLSQAIGLDETWRKQVLEAMLRDDEVPLPWLLSEGLTSEMTGAGYLRALDSSSPELLSMELGLVNSYIWSSKLVWLDLLSMLQQGSWYNLSLLFELIQLVCACSLFEHLAHVLEYTGMAQYLPVQRASFLTDSFHSDAFEAWVRDIFTHLLVPLGVAVWSDDGQRVCLDVKQLRIPTPPGLPDEDRVNILRDIFQDPELEFKIPTATHAVFGLVSDPPEGSISLNDSLESLIERVQGWLIGSYDGKYLALERVL